MAVDHYGHADFSSIEDRLANVSAVIRTIRQGLQTGPVTSVRLNFGTFQHYVGELEQLAEKHLGDFNAQVKAEELRRKKRASKKTP